MRVKIYNCIDLNNPLRDFEVEQTNLTVLELLEHSLQRLNLQNLKDNVTVFSDGQEVPCDIWSVFKLTKTKCLKFVIKPQGFQHRYDYHRISRCSLHNGYDEKAENK